jgi:LysM repeat protein
LRLNRFLAHAVVLAVGVAISGATMDPASHFPNYLTARLGAVNAEAVAVSQNGTVGDTSLGRYDTIIKPISIPTSAPVGHTPLTYTVLAGETLPTIAAKFNLTVAQIRWSNTDLISSETVSTGTGIVIPPVPGIVITVKSGDTLDGLAAKYQVDPQIIYDFNRIRALQLVAGTQLVIPHGVGGDFPPPPALYLILGRTAVGGAFPVKVIGCCLGPYPATGFPAGWCTFYVATKRSVTWRGDAGWWYANAAAKGYAVGPSPKVGAIMVTWESALGHLGYVESVNPDGSWIVTEMNYVGFGIIDQRTIKPGQLGARLIGFIY